MEHVLACAIGAWPPDGGSLRRAKIGFPVIARDRRGFCRWGRPFGGLEWTILVDHAAAIRDALA
jgi:hypothetical protein